MAARAREIDAPVEHVGPVHEQRTTHAGRGPLRRVELGIAVGHEDPVRSSDRPSRRRRTRWVGALPSSTSVRYRNDSTCHHGGSMRGGQPRVVAVGVHRLLEVRVACVLRAHLGLVHAQVGALQRALHEVDDRRVHAQPAQRAAAVVRELACENRCCSGRNAGPVERHLGVAAPQLRACCGPVASSPPGRRGTSPGRGKQVPQIVDRRRRSRRWRRVPRAAPSRLRFQAATSSSRASRPAIRRPPDPSCATTPVRTLPRRITLRPYGRQVTQEVEQQEAGKVAEGEARRQARQARRQAPRDRELTSVEDTAGMTPVDVAEERRVDVVAEQLL